MEMISRDGVCRFYFGASYGSAQTALRRLEEPHVMLSYATENNRPWKLDARHQKAAPSLFIDNGAYSIFEEEGWYQTAAEEYVGYVAEATDEMDAANDVRFSLRDVPVSDGVLSATGLDVEGAQRATVDCHRRCLDAASDLGVDATPYTVVQGRTAEDYLEHLEMHADAGTLGDAVGVGSLASRDVCEAGRILSTIWNWTLVNKPEIRIHGYGVTPRLLINIDIRDVLDSVDSSKWSYGQYGDRIATDERMCHLMAKKYVDTKRTVKALYTRDTCEAMPDAKDGRDAGLCESVLEEAIRDGRVTLVDGHIWGIPVSQEAGSSGAEPPSAQEGETAGEYDHPVNDPMEWENAYGYSVGDFDWCLDGAGGDSRSTQSTLSGVD